MEYLKREWDKLKDNYRKCLQRREKITKSVAENKKFPTCSYFTKLSFLKDIVSNRKTISNVEIVSAQSQTKKMLLHKLTVNVLAKCYC